MIFVTERSEKYERVSHYNKLEILSCEKKWYEKGKEFKANVEGCHRLVYILSGRIVLNDEKKILTEHGCFLVPQYNDCHFSVKEDAMVMLIHFESDMQLDILKSGELCITENAISMKEYVKRLHETDFYNEVVPAIREALLLILLDELWRSINTKNSDLQLYIRCMTWLEENVVRAITVADAAAAMGCSKEHLTRVVKRSSARALGDIIAQKRVENIKALASSGKYTIAEIAEILDFYSSELLRKYFRYHTGQSLAAFIRLQREEG